MGTLIPLLILFFWTWTGAAVLTVSPESVVAPVYTTATFTCEGTGNALHWIVQGGQLTLTVQQERNITFTDPGGPGNLSSILTVPALPINDGIGIGCYILSNPGIIPAFSNSATLTVRGVSPVEDLQLNFTSNNSLNMTWSPPVYESDDIPIESTLSYNVLVTNKTGDIIVDKTITDTFIEVFNITDCDTFDVSVTALKGQYVSINKTNGNNGSLNNPVPIEKNTWNFLKPNVTFNLNCPPSKCWNILTVTSDDEVLDQHLFTGSDKNVSYTRTLLPSKEYNYTIKVMNLRNISEHENYTIITTYQVSDLNIINQYTNGSVNVQCVFVSGSTADGCHVIFTDTNDGRNESFNIMLPEESKQVSLPTGGIYTVTVYDIYNGSVYGPAVYHSTPVSVVIPTLSPSSISSVIGTSSTSFSGYFSSNSVITTSPTVPIETETAPSSPTTGSVLYVIAGVISIVILIIVITLIVMVLLVATKRAAKKGNVDFNSGRAACHQPQADANDYQELIPGVTSNRSSEAAPPNGAKTHSIQQDNSPATTTTTAIPSIEVQSNNSSGYSPYLDNHETYHIPSTSSTDYNNSATVTVSGNSAAYATVTININDTTAPVNPPTGVQPVMYSEVAGDITKRANTNNVKFVPPSSDDDAIKQETSDINSSQCLPVAPKLVIGVPSLAQGTLKNIARADIEIEDDYDITVSFTKEDDSSRNDEVVKSSGASVHSPTSAGDTHKSELNKDGYNDDHTGKTKNEDFIRSDSQEKSFQPTSSDCVSSVPANSKADVSIVPNNGFESNIK